MRWVMVAGVGRLLPGLWDFVEWGRGVGCISIGLRSREWCPPVRTADTYHSRYNQDHGSFRHRCSWEWMGQKFPVLVLAKVSANLPILWNLMPVLFSEEEKFLNHSHNACIGHCEMLPPLSFSLVKVFWTTDLSQNNHFLLPRDLALSHETGTVFCSQANLGATRPSYYMVDGEK